ncbi:MAG: NAD(P)-binding domain-containing protein [Dysgonomonas mossii]|uniref:NADPH-dependent F420 reductase n=1 Tax=Dysgonomonas mossii TaxID=163665 RepID=UPI0026E9994A|nr:NAD(P)-binding domain-containing protein [Dysgonomonas mossii]MBS5908247.1 NAD(P)-binding domain-containing protein [Dysgonomonas mossii]
MKKIGIIGTGNMGRVLGLALAKKGYQVFFGARDLEKSKYAASLDETTLWGNNQEAAEFGEIVYYSPRDVNPKEVLIDIKALDGKVIIESGNWNISENLDIDDIKVSKTQILQGQLPNSKIVKAFNTIMQEIFEYTLTDIKSHNISCFIASDHIDAVNTVIKLSNTLGFVGVDCGSSKQAVLLEQLGSFIRVLARLRKTPWIYLSINNLDSIAKMQLGGRTASMLHTQSNYLKST